MTGETPGTLWSGPQSADVAGHPIKRMNEAVYLRHPDFRVVRTLRGGMGEVFICETKSEVASEKHRFALKTFQKRFFFNFHFRAAFLQEAATWARLTGCLHVMPALGLITFDQRPCVRMMALEHSEDVPVTVRELLANGVVPPEDVLAVALQTALGMQEATKRVPGLIHGDLKPDNLLLTPNTVWISDFGLARIFNPDRPGLPLHSTFCYQAPEVFDDPAATTPSADIYAFGLMLYELLTGRRAIEVLDREASAEAHRRLRLPELPPPGRRLKGLFQGQPEDLACALSRLAIACAARSPQDRPSDFSEVFAALIEIAGQYDLIRQMDRFMVWRSQQAFLEDIRRQAAPDLVDALFNLEEPELALDLIEDIGTADLSPRLLHMKGTALSLLRREDEALTCLDQVLRSPQLSDAQRLSTMIERALALKRLKRFDEAIAIFESLLQSADDEDLPRIVTNLATVHQKANDNTPPYAFYGRSAQAIRARRWHGTTSASRWHISTRRNKRWRPSIRQSR